MPPHKYFLTFFVTVFLFRCKWSNCLDIMWRSLCQVLCLRQKRQQYGSLAQIASLGLYFGHQQCGDGLVTLFYDPCQWCENCQATHSLFTRRLLERQKTRVRGHPNRCRSDGECHRQAQVPHHPRGRQQRKQKSSSVPVFISFWRALNVRETET